MSLYGSDNPPAHVAWFLKQFPGAELRGIGAINGSWWDVQQDDVALHVEQDFQTIKLRLQGSPARGTSSKVSSREKTLRASRPTRGDVSEIHEAYRQSLEEFARNGDTLYDAFVNTFGDDAIISDNRSEK